RRVLFRSVLDPRDRCSARPLAAHPVISFESPHHSVPPPPPCGERLRSHHRCASCTLPSSDIIRLISGAGWQSFPAQQIWTSLFPGARRATGSTHRRDASKVITNSTGRTDRRGFLKASGALAGAAGLTATIGACAPDDAAGSNGGSAVDVVGCTAAKEANPDGTIHAAISYELRTNGYDPMSTSAALTVAVNWHTLEGLTELHPATREAYAALATQLPETEDTTVEVTLREGAVFH